MRLPQCRLLAKQVLDHVKALFPVTLDLHITYFKPVPTGPRAIVEACVDRLGR